MTTRETHGYSDAHKFLLVITGIVAVCFLAGVDAGLDKKAEAAQATKADRIRIMAALSPCSDKKGDSK